MADLTTTTTTLTGGCGGNGFKRRSRKQIKHVELSPWIADMINIIEPKVCSIHSTNKLDRFCIKCVQPFCNECSWGHDGHEHLQASNYYDILKYLDPLWGIAANMNGLARYSYSCVVKRPDFQKHFDCSGIQSYKTNHNKVLYIKQKRALQQVKEEQINTKKVCCIVCNLTIIDEDYCSIECKVEPVYVQNRVSVNEISSLKEGKLEWRKMVKCKYVRSGCTTALDVVPWETDGESVLRESCSTRASMTNTQTPPTVVNTTGAPVTNAVANHAEKPEKFNGQNFKRWQQKMFFYLTTLGLARFLKETAP
ncbi:retrotransposon protein, putative, ty1-copia subclass [Tanacetum coccineum]